MKGIKYRVNEFFDPAHQRSILVDASSGMSLGVLPGLADFEPAIRSILPSVDGMVCGPGQLQRIVQRGQQDAGLLVRVDWTNTLRSADFVLPPTQNIHMPLFHARDALDWGAVAMVTSFLLGYEEEVEAACIKTTVSLAMEGKQAGIPLVVEVRASGPRVSHPAKAVELGASYALEGGADIIVIPNPGSSSLKAIGEFVSVPWLLKPSSLEKALEETETALELGGSGVWLDHTLFAQANTSRLLMDLRALLGVERAVG